MFVVENSKNTENIKMKVKKNPLSPQNITILMTRYPHGLNVHIDIINF